MPIIIPPMGLLSRLVVDLTSTVAFLGESGIALNGTTSVVDDDGCEWAWNGADPWSPSPNVRAIGGDRTSDHGEWDATQFYGARSYALEGEVQAATHEALHRAKTRLFAACGVSLFDFRAVEPNYDRTAKCRRDGEVLWTEITPEVASFSVPLKFPDPRVFSTDVFTTSAGLPSSVGGLSWPTSWPARWDATTVSGSLSVNNEGTIDASPRLRIDGVCADVTITNQTTGQVMRLSGLDLAVTEFVIVDCDTHQVLDLGDPLANRRSWMSGGSDWITLAPGPNTITWDAGSGIRSGIDAARLTLTYQHTSI